MQRCLWRSRDLQGILRRHSIINTFYMFLELIMLNRKENHLPNLLDFTLEEMEKFISSSGKEKYRARQIMKWLHQSGSLSFNDMTTLSRDFREKLAAIARIQRPEIIKILTSQDGTTKALL